MKVFVYGTLKKGYGNNRLLADKPCIGEAITIGTFTMLNSGFPVLLPSREGLPVKGEVYDITGDAKCLDNLDMLEGEGTMYDRREIEVNLGGEHVTVSVYIGNAQYWRHNAEKGTDKKYITPHGFLEWGR